MSNPVSSKYLMARGASTFLSFLHLDATVVALAFVIVLGVMGDFTALRAMAARISNYSLVAEAPAMLRPADAQTPALTPAMAAALDHVVQRYRVSAEALLPVFEEVQSAARERRLDPLLIIAVIAIESRFNPFSQSSMGAQGLMQVIPRYHQDKLPKVSATTAFLDPVMNVRIGSQILHEAIRRQGGLMEGLQYYAGAIDDEEQAYANKVLAEKLRLEQAARRRDGTSA